MSRAVAAAMQQNSQQRIHACNADANRPAARRAIYNAKTRWYRVYEEDGDSEDMIVAQLTQWAHMTANA